MIGNEALQIGIFNTLQDAGLNVYQYVPTSATYPLVAMGEEYIISAHTKTGYFMEIVHTIHAYSSSINKKEINNIISNVMESLKSLLVLENGFYVSVSSLEDITTRIDNDGVFHSTMAFNFRIGKE